MIDKMIKQKWNKKGFLARDYVMALILFSGVIALAMIMVSSMADDYSNSAIVDSSISENYANLEETSQIASSAFDAANEKEGLSFFGTAEVFFNSAFTVISLIFNSVAISGSYMASFGEDFGVPTAVSQILFSVFISILMVIIVFVVLSTTTQRRF